jgi:hypothetical protein
MSSSGQRPWIVLLIAAGAAAYGAYVAYDLVHATFIAPGAFGGAFWVDALYVISGVLAAAIAWGILPQSMSDQTIVAVSIPIRIAAVAGFWIPVIVAGFRLVRRFMD